MKDGKSKTLVREAPDHAEKISVSIPAYLFEWGERERRELDLNRSEFVAYLYQRVFDQVEHQKRVARYVEAYARVPETNAERALTEAFTRSVDD